MDQISWPDRLLEDMYDGQEIAHESGAIYLRRGREVYVRLGGSHIAKYYAQLHLWEESSAARRIMRDRDQAPTRSGSAWGDMLHEFH